MPAGDQVHETRHVTPGTLPQFLLLAEDDDGVVRVVGVGADGGLGSAAFNRGLRTLDTSESSPPEFHRKTPQTLLNAVTGAGASVATSGRNHCNFTLVVKASAVTVGGVIQFEGSQNGSDWGLLTPDDGDAANLVIANRQGTISDNGTFILEFHNVKAEKVRANLSVRTDGTYTAILGAGR